MSLDDWNDGWIEGQRDMLAQCISEIENWPISLWQQHTQPDGTKESKRFLIDKADVLAALRALQEVDTPRQRLNEHINFDTANRIGDDTTLQNAGREPYKSPVRYDPRAAENRP
jgi:hypothetical protein